MSFRFEKLEIWQDARKFVNKIYKVTKNFPSEERFGLVDQIRRAALSIILNIAEGSDRKSDKDFARFLRTSITSVEEVVSALYIALDQGYLKQLAFDELYTDSNQLVARINALIKSFGGRRL